MDELTIKQKAEAYDKAIEKLRDFYRDYDTVSLLINVKEELANMFPEIKESEDERIKTFIRGLLLPHIADVHLEGDKVVHNKDIDNYRKALAWLDKQKGEKKPNPYSGTSFEYNGHTWGMCARDNGVDILYDKHIIGHFEKQGATKLLDYDDFTFKSAMEAANEEKVDNANKVEPKFKVGDVIRHKEQGFTCKIIAIDTEYRLSECNGTHLPFNSQDAYELVKQKPADKVEPKFHEGDWVVSKLDGKARQISEVHCDEYNDYYIVEGDEYQIEEYDRLHHLWSIADAKPGDVLFHSDSASNGIFIFKELLKYEFSEEVICYCDYDSEDGFCLGDHHTCCWADAKILHPATKEQREQLEKAIADAGYVWFSGKKELKKIEDELITDTEIPFGAKDSELEEVFYSIPNGFHAEIEDNKVVIKKGEQKHWSKEDEEQLNDIIGFLPGLLLRHDWLKSLKYRIQAKQESSDEHYELEEFAKIVRCNLIGISKAVQKLFEAKYLQLTGNVMYGGLKD